MHIVYLTNEYPREGLNHGGVGSFVQFLGRALVAQGCTVSVVGINNKSSFEYEEDQGVQIYREPKSRWKYGKFVQHAQSVKHRLGQIHRKTPINFVEGSELSFAFLPKKTEYQKIIRLHGGHHFFAIELGKKPAFWRAYQEKKSFKKADHFVAVSNYVGQQTRKYLNYDFNFTTIYNSVNTQKFAATQGQKVNQNHLLFVGTVCEKKGIRQLVMAMKYVVKELPEVQLKVVGRDWFFPNGKSYTEYLRTYIDQDIRDHIHLMGPQPHEDIPNLIAQSAICIFPSHMEAMPIAWLEALAVGKATIASDIGPGREAIQHEKTGLLVDPHNPESIAQTIIHLFKSPELQESLGKNASQDIRERFDAEAIVAQNVRLYNTLKTKA